MHQTPGQLPDSYTLRAKWLLPGDAKVRENVFVTVRGGRIASLAAAERVEPMLDLGDALILPGLVNAHTHLEFSDLAEPLGWAGISLPDWIRLLVQSRRKRTCGPEAAIEAGLRESLAAGVMAVGEIATSGWRLPAMETPPLVTAFYESIALSSERAVSCLAEARAFFSPEASPNCSRGLSPHAPYTVRPSLLAELIALAVEHEAPVAMHVAESLDELELLSDGRGALVDLLAELGAWRPGAIPLGARPLDYLVALSRAPRALVIHGNYLDDEALDFLAAHRDHMSLVYCPRTHDYFGHAPYHDLPKLLRRGVRVCVGTDSRASNPDLSLLSELRFLAHRSAGLGDEDLLRLGASAGARALGQRDGCVRAGERADFVILRRADRAARDPWDLIWDSETPIAAVIRAGKVIHGDLGFADRAT